MNEGNKGMGTIRVQIKRIRAKEKGTISRCRGIPLG